MVNRLGGLSLPRKSVVRFTDRPDMTLNVYRGRKTTNKQQQQQELVLLNTPFGNKDPLVRNIFEKYEHPFNEPQLLYDIKDSKRTIN